MRLLLQPPRGFVAALPEKCESRRIYVEHIFHFTAAEPGPSGSSKQNEWQAATVKFPAHRRHLMHCARRICCQDIAAGLLRQ